MKICSQSGSTKVVFILLLLVAICFGGFIYWRSACQRNTPLAMARITLNAVISGDEDAVKRHLTTASMETFDFGSISAFGEGVGGSKEFKENREYELKLASSNKNDAKVSLKLLPSGYNKVFKMLPASIPQNLQSKAKEVIKDTFKEGIPIALVKEDGEWKVDGQKLDTAMNDRISCITEKLFELMRNAPGLGILSVIPGISGVKANSNVPKTH
jgi:hypothetical protein